jgi:hypothetical protein
LAETLASCRRAAAVSVWYGHFRVVGNDACGAAGW